MTALDAARFPEFFTALYGCEPFPWQMRLARRLFREGAWPALLDLPTGSGKTAALDLAVYHLASQAGRATDRAAALRIVYLVDRRTLVDQAWERARGIARSLEAATGGILAEVREALQSYTGTSRRPLEVALLRGGIPRSDAWARRPDQPLVAVSTVDQVGSRLLFRGYGVSPSMRPVHAGLLGNDALYLLDEVHLSVPFCQTLDEVRRRYRSWASCAPPSPFSVVQMSATPREEGGDRLGLDAEDRAHPVLRRRLESSKPTELVEAPAPKFLAEVEKHARVHAARPGSATLVVVNRVDSARRLAAALGSDDRFDVHLVTGRMRPLDRERAEAALVPRVRAGRQRRPEDRPVVAVATQCIEAGADFDFDAVVTECASLDALRQRMGRLDRLGELGTAPAVIVASRDTLKEDPVYGPALGRTWAWLAARGEVDFGLARMEVPDGGSDLLAPRSQAPVLLPAHLDSWAQTSPEPRPDPEVALWLHGPRSGAADGQVVWRADLTEALLADPSAAEAALALVEAVPPSPGEALAVPFAALSRWLLGQPQVAVSDVEGVEEPEEAVARGKARPCVLWRGEDSRVVPADQVAAQLRPGDTVVVPAAYGGLTDGTWDPTSTAPVRDLGDLAAFRFRGRAVLRLAPEVLRSATGDPRASAPAFPADPEEPIDERALLASWLDAAAAQTWPTEVRDLIRELRAAGARLSISRVDVPGGAPRRTVLAKSRRAAEGQEVNSEDDSGSFTGEAVPLARHLEGVGRRAEDFASRLGLPRDLAEDLLLAGLWHDAGKADPRFQLLLHGGSVFRASLADEPLAKSARVSPGREQRLQALRRSGYPPGTRHELQSVALLEASDLLAEARDPDLVLHLVATHHGRCRPFAPWVPDPDPVEVHLRRNGVALHARSDHGLARLDSGVADRFWRLVRRYGWWGLAWLEAILRLADHAQSAAEQEGEVRA